MTNNNEYGVPITRDLAEEHRKLRKLIEKEVVEKHFLDLLEQSNRIISGKDDDAKGEKK